MKRKLIVSLLCISMLTTCLTGCKGTQLEAMEAEPVYTYGFDFLGGQDVMPITGFYGPMPSNESINGQSIPDYFTDEFWQDMADCGINLLQHSYTDYEYTPELVDKMLDLGYEKGIGICVYDSRIISNRGASAITLAEMDERTNEYRNHPAFCGLYLADEPTYPAYTQNDDRSRDIETYAPLFEHAEKLDLFGAGNLMILNDLNRKEAYKQYIEEYLTKCPVEYLSFDHYVFDRDTYTEYFYNLDIIRKYANEYEIPFWSYIQAGAQWNDTKEYFDSQEYFPNEGEFYWNVNTTLAFGAKGIEYFPIIQPNYFAWAKSTDYDFERNGLFGAWGNKTRWYYYAQNINQQIAAIDEVLMNSVSKGILVNGNRATKETAQCECLLEGRSWRELKDFSGDALIGCFNYQGKTALYIVNYDMEYAQNINLQFNGNYNMMKIQNTETEYIKGTSLELAMGPGEGVLLVFE